MRIMREISLAWCQTGLNSQNKYDHDFITVASDSVGTQTITD